MKHAVILFDEKDAHVAQRLEKSLALMQKKGTLRAYSSLHILPGMDVQATMAHETARSEVTIIVLSIDLNQDLIFSMIDKHAANQTDLLVVYANYVEDALLEEFLKHNVPITPIMPIASHQNPDEAYKKITQAVRSYITKQLPAASAKTKQSAKTKKQLLVLLAARRNMQTD